MVKKAGIIAFFAVISILTFGSVQKAHAETQKVSLAITNHCTTQSQQLFVARDQYNCIESKAVALKPKLDTKQKKDSKPVQTQTAQAAKKAPVQISTTTTAPVEVAAATDTSPTLNSDVIFSMINDIRAQNGLAPFEKDAALCAIAQSRAPEIYSEIFVTHTMHAGFYGRNLPYWATENLIHQNTEAEAVNWWMNSPVHRAAILGNYKFSCGACLGKSCCQLFTSYLPK